MIYYELLTYLNGHFYWLGNYAAQADCEMMRILLVLLGNANTFVCQLATFA